MLRYLTAGESHGKALTAILEGMVSNLSLSPDDINRDLARRQMGYGRGGRMKIEKDNAEILSGVRNGKTMGSPISLMIRNLDWENWEDVMTVETGDKVGVEVTNLRPGHADLAGMLKYNQKDLRNILERSSARETAARVAVGAVAKKFLAVFGVAIGSFVEQIGKVKYEASSDFALGKKEDGWREILAKTEKSQVRCPDEKASKAMMDEIDQAGKDGDSLGGVFKVLVLGCPPGLGSHVHWDRKLKTNLSAALMSIQAVKGVEIGIGFEAAGKRGSEVHDEIFYEKKRFVHKTNNAGGLEGGMSNGEPIILRAAVKPIATLVKPIKSIDLRTKKQVDAHVERADVCAVPAAGVIGEAVAAIEIANAFLEKFGGDSVEEALLSYNNYLKYLLTV